MAASALSRYRENQILTGSPAQILLALYDGALRFAHQARTAIEANDPATKGEMIARVIAIVSELSSTLDHERDPQLCANLERLYDFMLVRVSEAGARMSVAPLDEVIKQLEMLRATWVEAAEAADGAA